jgi:hypothetical protein
MFNFAVEGGSIFFNSILNVLFTALTLVMLAAPSIITVIRKVDALGKVMFFNGLIVLGIPKMEFLDTVTMVALWGLSYIILILASLLMNPGKVEKE